MRDGYSTALQRGRARFENNNKQLVVQNSSCACRVAPSPVVVTLVFWSGWLIHATKLFVILWFPILLFAVRFFLFSYLHFVFVHRHW